MLTDEFLEGWKAARLQYQNTGGVPPYPPNYRSPSEEENPPPSQVIGGDEDEGEG